MAQTQTQTQEDVDRIMSVVNIEVAATLGPGSTPILHQVPSIVRTLLGLLPNKKMGKTLLSFSDADKDGLPNTWAMSI